jgi:aspartyl-tRNA(Asn)/glutamyl-tRNA(Gln) amidotransferase subunit C
MADESHKRDAKIDVAYVAHLARIDLTDSEKREFQAQLDQIVEYFRQLAAVDVSSVEPMAHAAAVQNVFREDQVRESLDRATVLANAPVRADDQFSVPKIIE